MVAAANLVEVAALVGDTARATMLNALMGGQSLTATELAYCANVSRSTASGHLSKLVAARLLTKGTYSLTPSASCCKCGGTSRPNAFAVLRLMASSNLVGVCTGTSAGFSPR